MVTAVHATDTLKEEQKRIEEERKAVQGQLSKAEEKLNELVEERQRLKDEIALLNESIEQFEEMIEDVEEKIDENKEKISLLEEEIIELQEELDYRYELLKEKAVAYQKSGTNISYLEVIFGAESFSDFISRLISLTKISQADDNFIEQTLAKEEELLDKQKKFSEKQAELEEQLEEIEVIHEVVREERDKTEQLFDEIKENEKEQEKLITQLIEEEKQLGLKENEIRKQIEEEIKRKEEQRRAEEEARRNALANENQQLASRGSKYSNNNIKVSEGWQTFIATAYTANCKGCSGVTATGINLRNNPNAKVIAVDPSVIPLGSKVEIKGYGTYLAADIGGAIKGKRIDIFMSDKNAAKRFGHRAVQIRIVN